MIEKIKFDLKAPFSPAGDQPKAIDALVAGLHRGYRQQTLLGVTGSGKTFTMANVIQQIQKPTLVIAHNKTLAAQLTEEFRAFFPNNAVHYFVSYYDYYQPEAYLPSSDTYIEKDSSINDEIDRLRNAATQALMTRSDVIIVASVSCIYGLGSPEIYKEAGLTLEIGQTIKREQLVRRLVDMMYERNDLNLGRSKFRVKGGVIEIFPAYSEHTFRLDSFGDILEKIEEIDPVSGRVLTNLEKLEVFPAKHFLTDSSDQERILSQIDKDCRKQVTDFQKEGRLLEAERLEQRTGFDLEMIRETGFCNGIENYSRYFDQRPPGSPPSVLLDYLPADYLLFIDESHITVPQIRGMYYGDLSRKNTLIHYGFRLLAAKDNRPLKFSEFEQKIHQVIFVSATPNDYEISVSTDKNQSVIEHHPITTPDGLVEQIIRPTGLVDPAIEIRPAVNQVDDLIAEIRLQATKNQRVLVTTLTKRMAEDLSEYLLGIGIKVQYLHSEIKTLERLKIIQKLRSGELEVIIGINLLREGLDLPEVSLVAILDADREGFLRNTTSFIQTIGRAARHLDGRVIMYANQQTASITSAVQETERRRQIQLKYNQDHHITPKSISKEVVPMLAETDQNNQKDKPDFSSLPSGERKRLIASYQKQMTELSERLDYEKAAYFRDLIKEIRQLK